MLCVSVLLRSPGDSCGQANWGVSNFQELPSTNLRLEFIGIGSQKGTASWSKTLLQVN